MSYLRAAFSLFLVGLGACYALSGEAKFQLGGDDLSNRHAIHVDAHGLDAVVVGLVFVGVGVVSLAQDVQGPARIRVFWAGAAVLAATILYSAVNAVRAILSLFH